MSLETDIEEMKRRLSLLESQAPNAEAALNLATAVNQRLNDFNVSLADSLAVIPAVQRQIQDVLVQLGTKVDAAGVWDTCNRHWAAMWNTLVDGTKPHLLDLVRSVTVEQLARMNIINPAKASVETKTPDQLHM